MALAGSALISITVIFFWQRSFRMGGIASQFEGVAGDIDMNNPAQLRRSASPSDDDEMDIDKWDGNDIALEATWAPLARAQ